MAIEQRPSLNHTGEAVSFASNQVMSHPLLLQMDHLATPSREADLGPIVDEELGNIPHPFSLQSTSRAGIPVPLSNAPELVRGSA